MRVTSCFLDWFIDCQILFDSLSEFERGALSTRMMGGIGVEGGNSGGFEGKEMILYGEGKYSGGLQGGFGWGCTQK
jgi:hypothetical protein